MGAGQGRSRALILTYAIVVRPSARKRFLALDKQTRSRVGAAIDALAEDPRPNQVVKVKKRRPVAYPGR